MSENERNPAWPTWELLQMYMSAPDRYAVFNTPEFLVFATRYRDYFRAERGSPEKEDFKACREDLKHPYHGA